MPALITDIRQLRRQKAALPVEPQPVAAAPTPVITDPYTIEVITRMSPLDTELTRMLFKNPVLATLIDTLDLEPAEVKLPPGNARLWELAGQALRGGQLYTRAQAVECIKINTAVSQERAERGFTLMLESGAIERAINADANSYNNELFYLGGSTPF